MATLKELQEDIAAQLAKSFPHLSESKKREMCRYGLIGEVGEVMELYKGDIRGYPKDLERCTEENLKSELGDVLWYLTALCVLHDFSLDEIYQINCDKLDGRRWR